jgi:hypothetical protein
VALFREADVGRRHFVREIDALIHAELHAPVPGSPARRKVAVVLGDRAQLSY